LKNNQNILQQVNIHLYVFLFYLLTCTVEQVFFLKRAIFKIWLIWVFGKAELLEFAVVEFLPILKKSKFSRKANTRVLNTNTQFLQLVSLQNSRPTIITSAKHVCHYLYSLCDALWFPFFVLFVCVLLFHETNGLKVSRKHFGK